MFPCNHGFTFHCILLGNWQSEHSLAIHQPKEEDVAMEAPAEGNDLRSPQVCCLNMPKLERGMVGGCGVDGQQSKSRAYEWNFTEMQHDLS